MKIQKKQYLVSWLAVVALMLGLSVQVYASNLIDVNTQERSLPQFSSVKLTCSADLIITQGNTQKVVVKADSRIIDDLKTEVKDGVLTIEMKRHFAGTFNIHVLEVHITVPALHNVLNYGSGDLIIKDGFKATDFNLVIGGSGDFDGDLQVNNMKLSLRGSGDAKFKGVTGDFELSVMGSGDVEGSDLQLTSCVVESMGSGDTELSGETKDLTLSSKGSGDFSGYSLKATSANISSYGSGDAVVNVSESIRARLYGSGDVVYKGSADKVSVSTHGSGEVYKK